MFLARSSRPALALSCVLVLTIALRFTHLRLPTSVEALVILASSVLLGWRLVLISKCRGLPWVSDELFIGALGGSGKQQEEKLIEARRWIARRFAIPPERLAPNQELGALAKQLDFLTNAYIGLNEIEENLADLYEDAGEPVRNASGLTVAIAASEMVRIGLIK